MTNTEKLINHVSKYVHRANESGAPDYLERLEWELEMLSRMLKTLPSYDEDKAFEVICDHEEEPEIPEDNAMYRTFDSDTFHVGDEVFDGTDYGIVTCNSGCGFYVVMDDGSAGEWDRVTDNWKRTGRNFPAIENILKIIAKENKE